MVEKVSVTIDFPFRARFYWDLEEKTFHSFQEAWDECSSFFAPSKNGGLGGKLSDAQKFAILDKLAVESTRNIGSPVPWDYTSEVGFVVDPFRSQVVTYPAEWSSDEIAARIFTVFRTPVFSFQVAGGRRVLVRDGEEAMKRATEEAVMKKTAEAHAELLLVGTTKLRVFFPYRALFCWDANAEQRMNFDGRFSHPAVRKAIVKDLKKDPVFGNRQVVAEYDAAWWGVCRVDARGLAGFTNELRVALLDVLTVPGTRGAEGYASYRDRTKPELG